MDAKTSLYSQEETYGERTRKFLHKKHQEEDVHQLEKPFRIALASRL
jgi:hypothetical protein